MDEKVRADSVIINFNLQKMIFLQLKTQCLKNLYEENYQTQSKSPTKK
jgi:hypothetical protein